MIFGVLGFGGHQIVDSLLRLGRVRWVVADVVSWVLGVFFDGDVSSNQSSLVLSSCSSDFACFVLMSATAVRNSIFHERPLFLNVHFFASVTVVSVRVNVCYGVVTHELSE